MLVILFGLTGAGKSYIGNLIASHFGFFYKDGDDWLSEDMVSSISKNEPFTQEMIYNFTSSIIKNIASLFAKGHKNIVISQALYRQKNRQQILDAFPGAIFIQIDAKPEVIAQRLKSRANNVDSKYAALIRKYFEPMSTAAVVNNNHEGTEQVIAEIRKLIALNIDF